MFKQLSITGILLLAVALPALADLQIGYDDPTRPPGLTQAPTHSKKSPNQNKGSRWILKSILVSPERRTAVINNRVVSIGDKISGATVISIENTAVHLRSHNGKVTLNLVANNIKTTSKLSDRQQGNQ